MRQRVAARLLLASSTLALGLGLGTAIAVTSVLGLHHPSLTVRSPGQAEGTLDRGRHHLSVSRADPGGGPPLSQSRPACTVTDIRAGREAAPIPADPDTGSLLLVEHTGRHRVECASAAPVTVLVDHTGSGTGAYLAAVGRGLLVAMALTALAAIWAARALGTVGRLRSSPPG